MRIIKVRSVLGGNHELIVLVACIFCFSVNSASINPFEINYTLLDCTRVSAAVFTRNATATSVVSCST